MGEVEGFAGGWTGRWAEAQPAAKMPGGMCLPPQHSLAWPVAGGRSGPGGPAEACAIAIHWVAAGPSMAHD